MSARLAKVCEYFCDWIRAAHNAIYKQGSPIKGTTPEHYLKPFLLVPTFVSDILCLGQLQETKLMLKNVFAEVLGAFSCNVYRILTVNLMHDFKLGVFKLVFRHLLHLLYAINQDDIELLNTRSVFMSTHPDDSMMTKWSLL